MTYLHLWLHAKRVGTQACQVPSIENGHTRWPNFCSAYLAQYIFGDLSPRHHQRLSYPNSQLLDGS